MVDTLSYILGSSGYAKFQNVVPGTYKLRLIATTESEQKMSVVKLTIPDDVTTCTVHLINKGVTINGTSINVEFGGVGPCTNFCCKLDRNPSFQCKCTPQLLHFSLHYSVSLHNLLTIRHHKNT